MLNIYIFLIIVGLLLFILGGISASSNIKNIVPYLLFWFMYIISLATIGNIFITVYYYYIMKDKTGPRGLKGPRGDKGNKGLSGQCNVGCRNDICINSVKTVIVDTINKLEKETGNYNSDFTIEDLKNLYIKEKIKSICHSTEFKQLVPYKGAKNLIAYISNIWRDITKRIYNAGGIVYFKTIGAENEWDWLDDNPWNEFKKYDIYYWGLSKEYRPKIKNKCNNINTDNIFDGSKYPEHRHLNKNNKHNYKLPSKKDSKYGILSYINTPTTFNVNDNNNYTNILNTKNNKKLKLYNAYTYIPEPEIQQKYEDKNNIHKLKPMTYLVSDKDNKCININKYGSVYYSLCDPYNLKQIFTLNFNDNKNKLKLFKLYNTFSDKSIGQDINGKIISKKTQNGDTYKFN